MNNCLFWALWMWFRYGGYIAIRRSSFGWWPHFLWSKDMTYWLHYTTDKKMNRLFPPILFKGYIKRGE